MESIKSGFQTIKDIITAEKDNYIENAFSLDEIESIKENAFIIRCADGFKIIFETVEQFKQWIEG